MFPTSMFLISSSPSRGATQEQDRRGRRDDIADPDDRFLRDLASALSGNGKNRRSEQSESQRDEKCRPTFKIEMEEDSDTNA